MRIHIPDLWRKVSLLSLILLCGTCQSTTTPAPHTEASVVPVSLPVAVQDTTVPSQSAKITATYTKDELLGRINQDAHPAFTKVGAPYTLLPAMYLRAEVAEAFMTMCKAAKQDGVRLHIISSTRNFDRQKAIWDRKWSGLAGSKMTGAEKAKNIMLYSAMPGCSRHHWGTDLDLNSLENHHFQKGGKHHKVYQWLVAHASEYGFCQVYSARSTGRSTGYEEERWHWSYMPTAGTMLAAYNAQITVADLTGFEGAQHAGELNVIDNYVKGIAEQCK